MDINVKISFCGNEKSSPRSAYRLCPFKITLNWRKWKLLTEENGNFIILDFNVHNQRLSLINPYGPNKGNPDFFKIISNYIDEIGNTDIIICGDYNCVLNPDLDYYNYKCLNNPKAREEVLDIINT